MNVISEITSTEMASREEYDVTSMESFLSANVSTVVCDLGVSDVPENRCLLNNGFIDWSYISKILPASKEDPTEYYRNSIQCLAPCFKHLQNELGPLTLSQYNERYSPYLKWTGNTKLFLESFELLHDTCPVNSLLSLLLVTAQLERSLGDVYLQKGTKCPAKLKDLLLTNELREVFGEVIISVLQTCIGPPVSLNLRNIAWHGFFSPAELPKQYVYFLMVLAPSLGYVMSSIDVAITHRQPVDFSHHIKLLSHLLPGNKSKNSEDLYSDIFRNTSMIPTSHQVVWSKCLHFYQQQRYGWFVVLLLPQIESALRCIFCSANNCSHRMLTAESDVLYTTLNEILSKYLSDGEENNLKHILGSTLMDFLHDLFVYPEGPRLRDRVSHGEVDLDNFSGVLAWTLLRLALNLAYKFLPNDANFQKLQTELIKGFSVSDYESQFHPVNIAKCKVAETFSLTFHVQETNEMLNNLMVECFRLNAANEIQATHLDVESQQQTPSSLPSQQPPSPLFTIMAKTVEVADSLRFPWLNDSCKSELISCLQNSRNGPVIKELVSHSLNTLYLGQKKPQNTMASSESSTVTIQTNEVMSLLQRVSQHGVEILQQTEENIRQKMDLLKQKKLRSRARVTLKTMVLSVPCLCLAFRTIMLHIISEIYTIETFFELTSQEKTAVVKCLKLTLKYFENQKTFTSLDKNRWTESMDSTLLYLETVSPKWLQIHRNSVSYSGPK
ncbi:endoplasmic reticulum membrane-associated RNA degradation protein-like isoform X1 [Octopus sinensis]|uniref:Endoplasmic reticulum membrane-associated RNA degradation protein-like isoform X1 n=2 Tax=Octopus sinensis TaxID=2607531 RepID=A0A6P7SYG9_9MOLL|nr:endoplasmic reticulum membrane-associated RNA degradation protein-like isoform X1 [Octopus sinensis]